MSYCRTSCEEGSDVYVFGSGHYLECYVAWSVSERLGIDNSFLVPYDSVAPEKTMVGHLVWLRSLGVRVPDHCTDRLIEEAGSRDIDEVSGVVQVAAKEIGKLLTND